MINPSSLSLAANQLRKMLADGINDINESHITISNPKDRLLSDNANSINLFFYKTDYSGFPADGAANEPMYVRLYCLITAYGADIVNNESGEEVITVPHGDNDLRLIGGVMNVLHASPTVTVEHDGNVMQLQAVIQHLSLDDINHIWSTQGEVPYRISIAYEFSLAPIPFIKKPETIQRVGSTGVSVRPIRSSSQDSDQEPQIQTAGPVVKRVVVDVTAEQWEPHICFIDDQNTLSYTTALANGSAVAKRDMKILIAGRPEATLNVKWEIWQPWDKQTRQGGWGEPQADEVTPQLVLPKATATLKPNILDPAHVSIANAFLVKLPISLPITVNNPAEEKNARRQAIVYVTHEWRENIGQQDEITRSVRSNPLLVSIYYQVDGG